MDPGAPLLASGVAAFARDASPAWVLPLVGMLLSIAVLPLVAHHWWERNRNRALVAAAWALPVLGFLLVERDRGGLSALGHAGMEYGSFLALLGSLYVVSGGILLTGDIRPTPRNNTLLLLVGGVLANLIGTTGASMLLVRPFLRMNTGRSRTTHSLVFFIFIVSNVGGCLTPLGDPPLFLGFLRGVPFWWTLSLWKPWAFLMAALLAAYFAVDTFHARRESVAGLGWGAARGEPVGVAGAVNFLFLGGILAAVLLLDVHWREGTMIAMAVLSLLFTPARVRARNAFTWGPLQEVGILFAGIFTAMVPALEILRVHGGEMGIREPWQYFAATGLLSSFLDNAPTYLVFFAVALGSGVVPEGSGFVLLRAPMEGTAFPEAILVAVSLGAVFMGAMTYIGNGPNFMVKAIAESAGQKMPSFFGFMAWSFGILGPLLVVTVLLFIR